MWHYTLRGLQKEPPKRRRGEGHKMFFFLKMRKGEKLTMESAVYEATNQNLILTSGSGIKLGLEMRMGV